MRIYRTTCCDAPCCNEVEPQRATESAGAYVPPSAPETRGPSTMPSSLEVLEPWLMIASGQEPSRLLLEVQSPSESPEMFRSTAYNTARGSGDEQVRSQPILDDDRNRDVLGRLTPPSGELLRVTSGAGDGRDLAKRGGCSGAKGVNPYRIVTPGMIEGGALGTALGIHATSRPTSRLPSDRLNRQTSPGRETQPELETLNSLSPPRAQRTR